MAATKPSKRLADEALSDDDDGPMFPLRKVVRREASIPNFSKSRPGVSSRSLEESLANVLPLNMIDETVRDYLIWQSNKRLEQARDESVNIQEISIGEDGLPVWPTLCWDSSIDPLHVMIYQSLDNLEVSQRLGRLVREELFKKGNQRLQKARERGVDLQDIYIGQSLLPEWRDQGVDDVIGAGGSIYTDHQQSSGTTESSSAPTPNDTTPKEAAVGSIWDSFLSSFAPVPHSSDSDDSDSEFDLGSSAENCSAQEQQDIFYTISLNNLVEDQASFSDASVNVFHDAEVAGAPRNYADIDFELYAATEDDEAEDLPEAEFTVDRDAFDYYFESDEAIDIEVLGAQLLCTGEIEDIVELADDSDEVGDESSSLAQFIQSSTITNTRVEQASQQTLDSKSVQIDQQDAASVVSEAVTSDEEMGGDIFEETEDGFQW